MISIEYYKKYPKIKSTNFFNNGPKYLDPFRKRLVNVTPEEKVRLRTAFFLRDVLGIPVEMINVEDHLSHYGIRKNLRADIVVCPWNSKPLAIIECKSSRVGLSDQTLEQAIRYASNLNAKYVFICDGINIECYAYENKNSGYILQIGLPHYSEMIKGIFIPANPINKLIQRTKLTKKINRKDYYWCIGENTLPVVHNSVVNLAEAFLDSSHRINPQTHNGIEFIEDLGLSYRQYGDASGGQFGTGDFRLLLVKHSNRKSYIYGLSVQATGKMINDPKYGYSAGKSVLVVTVRDDKTDTVAVQINLNEFLERKNGEIIITHNGKFAMKNAKSQEFISNVEMNDPELVNEGKVVLGKLPADKLLYIDQTEMMDLISNLFRYCNLRMKYKKSLRRKNRTPNLS